MSTETTPCQQHNALWPISKIYTPSSKTNSGVEGNSALSFPILLSGSSQIILGVVCMVGKVPFTITIPGVNACQWELRSLRTFENIEGIHSTFKLIRNIKRFRVS